MSSAAPQQQLSPAARIPADPPPPRGQPSEPTAHQEARSDWPCSTSKFRNSFSTTQSSGPAWRCHRISRGVASEAAGGGGGGGWSMASALAQAPLSMDVLVRGRHRAPQTQAPPPPVRACCMRAHLLPPPPLQAQARWRSLPGTPPRAAQTERPAGGAAAAATDGPAAGRTGNAGQQRSVGCTWGTAKERRQRTRRCMCMQPCNNAAHGGTARLSVAQRACTTPTWCTSDAGIEVMKDSSASKKASSVCRSMAPGGRRRGEQAARMTRVDGTGGCKPAAYCTSAHSPATQASSGASVRLPMSRRMSLNDLMLFSRPSPAPSTPATDMPPSLPASLPSAPPPPPPSPPLPA